MQTNFSLAQLADPRGIRGAQVVGQTGKVGIDPHTHHAAPAEDAVGESV